MLTLLAACLLAAPPAPPFEVEPGFTPLFDGKGLSGWKLKKTGESLDGTTAAGGRFAWADDELRIDVKVKGDVVIETAKPFGPDAVVRFEVYPGKGCNNDLFLHGAKFDIKPGDIPKLKLDDWNTFELTAKGGKVEVKVNGESVKTLAGKTPKTPFGVRAEAGPAKFRRFRATGMEK